MARRKIREATSKRLIYRHHQRLNKALWCATVTADTDWDALVASNPRLSTTQLVVKPDMLFGQRGKHDLVALNVSFAEAKAFVSARVGKAITVNGLSDAVTHFILEPFVPHKEEYYLSIQSRREGLRVLLSLHGGIHVEENWDHVRTHDIDVGAPTDFPQDFFSGFPEQVKGFVLECIRVFEDLDFTFLEMNPFCVATIDGVEAVVPLDMRGELDDQAAFKNQKKWGEVEFPKQFGKCSSPEEDLVANLDAQTGASLKFTVINPAGRIWLLVAGGGASVIYTDTVCDLGMSALLGNYGEYSGNPSDEHTYAYTKAVLTVATKLDESNPHRGRCLLIGGGVANFTDVKATFKGICKALLEFASRLRECGMKILVRRGGPNFEAALQMIKATEPGLGVPIDVFGPETHMTRIVHIAAEHIRSHDTVSAQ